ncbi:MAG: hypothetical protein U0W24_23260 [Bacteroidales bacterium]
MTRYDYKSRIANFMHWLGLVLVTTWFVMGFYILFTDSLNYVDKNTRFIFGFFFFAFGAFRGVKWLIKNKARKYYDETDIRDMY